MRILTVLLLLVPVSHALFKGHFQKFVRQKYGEEVLEALNRADLGRAFGGSFGGGSDEAPTK